MITKIVSGGQTGVDVASLIAAESAGVATGGVMPKGFQTQNGPRPEYAKRFGLIEDFSPEYAPRTRRNVQESDATLRIASNWLSSGERCTAAAIQKYKRPWFDISVCRDGSTYHHVPLELERAIDGLRKLSERLGRPLTVNVAGNSDKTAPGIGAAAEAIVRRVLDGTYGKVLQLGRNYRTRAVPVDVSDETLGRWYTFRHALVPPTGTPLPDSTIHQIEGSSCWPTWVVHRAPADVQAPFVARLLAFGYPTPLVVTGDTIEDVRAKIPNGLVRREAGQSHHHHTNVESWAAF